MSMSTFKSTNLHLQLFYSLRLSLNSASEVTTVWRYTSLVMMIIITIMYAHVAAKVCVSTYTESPFVLLVAGAPADASKVHAYGPGIEHGLLSTFQSHFVVDTAGAGSGQLTVKVRGPRGLDEIFFAARVDGISASKSDLG